MSRRKLRNVTQSHRSRYVLYEQEEKRTRPVDPFSPFSFRDDITCKFPGLIVSIIHKNVRAAKREENKVPQFQKLNRKRDKYSIYNLCSTYVYTRIAELEDNWTRSCFVNDSSFGYCNNTQYQPLFFRTLIRMIRTKRVKSWLRCTYSYLVVQPSWLMQAPSRCLMFTQGISLISAVKYHTVH